MTLGLVRAQHVTLESLYITTVNVIARNVRPVLRHTVTLTIVQEAHAKNVRAGMGEGTARTLKST